MRILLINHSVTIYKKYPGEAGPTIPMGIAYIASYIEQHRYETKILDCIAEGFGHPIEYKDRIVYGLSDKDLIKHITNYQPDVVGVNAMFSAHARDAHYTAALIKKINPKITVVFGGSHASISPEITIRDKNVDFIVYGEGEETFLELLETLKSKKSNFRKILGLVYKRNGKIIINEPRPFIANLDKLPRPAWHLLPIDIYYKVQKTNPYVRNIPSFNIMSSRGCFGMCKFCSIHSVWQHKWRPRSPKNVVDEIEFLVKKYGAKEIAFNDDSAVMIPQRMREICEEIIKRKLKISWTMPNGVTYWTLDKPLLELMKKAGCYRLTFGIESGNIQTRQFIGKIHSLEKAREIIKFANSLGFWTISTFILGFPHETREQMDDTINFAINSGLDFAAFYILCPIPGTEMYKICQKEKMIDFNEYDLVKKNIPHKTLMNIASNLIAGGFDTKYFRKQEILEIVSGAYKRFWRKRIISNIKLTFIRKIKSLEDLKYAYQLFYRALAIIPNMLIANTIQIRAFQRVKIKRVQ